MTTKSQEKIRLFALIEPLNLKMSLCFPADTLVAEIHHFVDDIMRKYNVKYKVGRVDWNGAWILPQYRIGDFFEDKTEITIYSIEYGLTLTSLSSERDRLHINHSVFYQDLNTNFLKKKLRRDKNKKSLTGNQSRTTEVNDITEIDATPEDENTPEFNNVESTQKNVQGVINAPSNAPKDKPTSNKLVKEKEKQRPEVNKVEKQEIPNKPKGKVENVQTTNPKQNVPQQKSKVQQNQSKPTVPVPNQDNESSYSDNDEDDYRNADRSNAKHKQSMDSDTDSLDQNDIIPKRQVTHTSKTR